MGTCLQVVRRNFTNEDGACTLSSCSKIPGKFARHTVNQLQNKFGSATRLLSNFREIPGAADEFTRLIKNICMVWDTATGGHRFTTFGANVGKFGAFMDGIGILGLPMRGVNTVRDVHDILFTKEHRVMREDVAGELPTQTLIRMTSEIPLTVFDILSFEKLLRVIGFYNVSEKVDGILEKVQIGNLCGFFVADTIGAGYRIVLNLYALRRDEVHAANIVNAAVRNSRATQYDDESESDVDPQIALDAASKTYGKKLVARAEAAQADGRNYKPSICLTLVHFVADTQLWLVPTTLIVRRIATITALSLAVFAAAVVSAKVIIAFALVSTVIGCFHIALDLLHGEVSNAQRYQMMHRQGCLPL